MPSTLFTAAIILGGVFIFIIVFKLLHKREHNEKLASQKKLFADIIWKSKLEIDESETISNYLLAVDKINFVLLYINFSSSKEEVVLVDLWQVRTVKVTTEDNSVYEQRKGVPILVDRQVDKLQLEITLADVMPKTNLVLFEFKDGHDLVYIKRRVDYWCHLINNVLQELPHPSRQSSKYA